MNTTLEDFSIFLQENKDYPLDELRDYYLVPAIAIINSNPELLSTTFNDQTPLMMVVEQLLKPQIQPIREIELNLLAMDIIDKTPTDLLNFQNKDGNSVIHLSTKRECFSVGVLDFLYSKGANFSLVNKNGETPLIQIASSHSLDDVKFIHAYTEPHKIDWLDNSGHSALFYAIKSLKLNNVIFLLSVGANLHKKNHLGISPFDFIFSDEFIKYCDSHSYFELLKIIRKK